MREIWEAAEALAKLGLLSRIDVQQGTLTVYRDGIRIGKLRFPVESDR